MTLNGPHIGDVAAASVTASYGCSPRWSAIRRGRVMIRFGYLRFALICAYVFGAESALVNDRCLEAQTTVYEYKVPAGGYNAVGNLTSYSDTINGAWTMVNDPLGRTVTAASTSGLFSGISLAEQYDSFGNRLSQQVSSSGSSQAFVPQSTWAAFDTSGSVTCPYSGSNRLCASSIAAGGLPTDASLGMTAGYDGAGNLISDGVTYARYDAEGRMCASYSTVGSGFTQYFYDAEGHRVGKASASAFVCPGASQPATGPILARYLVGPSGEQVTELDGQNNWVHSNVYADGSLLATYNQSGMHFPISDPLGSVRAEVSGAGQIDETCGNLPFGDGQNCSGPDAIENHFTGKERDAESGLDYFGARYYSSNMGRFSSPDPSGLYYADPTNPQSLNLYSYALNNPLKFIDPTGLYCDYSDHNDPSSGFDSSQFDYSSNSGECSQNGGQFVTDAYTHNGADDANRPQNAVSSNTSAGAWDFSTFAAYGSMYAAGSLPTSINYGQNDPATLAMINRPYVQNQLAAYKAAGCPATGTKAGQGSGAAYQESAGDVASGNPNYVQAEVGGYSGSITTSGGVTTVTLSNVSGISSLSGYSAGVGAINSATGSHFNRNAIDSHSGLGQNVTQTFKQTMPSPCGGG